VYTNLSIESKAYGAHRSIFKDDTEQEVVKVNEILILDLERAPPSEGLYGLLVTQAKAYLDPSPVQTKAKALIFKGK
jgi:hypothetical protein